MCARTTAKCKGELCGGKEENERQQIGSHAADVCEDLRPEQQAPESLHIKEEEETLQPPSIKEEVLEPHHIKDEEQEDEITKFPLTGVLLKREDDDEDHHRGSQSDNLLAPLSDSDNITSHSSDEDDDDDDNELGRTWPGMRRNSSVA
ncbi:uncharacterized protein LOC133418153 isoform X2 [Phycodurus eques]|uniref:uncharacterized protein LOC133418153 isoform X2 n=1 Tax=Phycodurus eques TaxID=693459 RepID=UPI002ACE3361|nr:uncharacterized protein LOC133418153 isoform X2 [Phycodurus eques]